jgi:hypothetical protein
MVMASREKLNAASAFAIGELNLASTLIVDGDPGRTCATSCSAGPPAATKRRAPSARPLNGDDLHAALSVAGSQNTRSPSSIASKLMVKPPPLPANLVS